MLELREDLVQKIFAYDAHEVANQRHMLTETQLPKVILTIPGELQHKFSSVKAQRNYIDNEIITGSRTIACS
jgi:hypothetical protein